MATLSYIKGTESAMTVKRNVPEQLKYRSEVHPDKEAFIFYSSDGRRESMTFRQLYKGSQQFSQALASLGIRKGNVIILYLHNTVEYLEVMFGIIAIGAIPVMSYITRKDFSDLEYVIENTNAVGLVFTGTDSSTISGLKHLTTRGGHTLKHVISVDITEDTDFLMSYKRIISSVQAKEDASISDIHIDIGDVAVIVRSSGSTGQPKLVALSHLNLCNLMRGTSRNFPLPNIKIFSTSSFSDLSGNPMHILLSNWVGVTMSGDQTSLQVEDVLKYTERESCNLVHYNYSILNTIINSKMKIPSSVLAAFVGGAPIKKGFEILLNNVGALVCSYGTTETGGIAECVVRKGMELKSNICGNLVPGVEVKIVGENQETVERGVKGTVFVRTSNLFLGYYNHASLTRNSVTEDLWFNTGDFGYVSDSGELYVLGREGDCVTVAPYTLHISEIENVLENLNLPGIKSIVVVPIPDEISHEQICACVMVTDGHSMTEDEFMKTTNEKISATFYKPKYVVFMDSFPYNRNGKLDRKLITSLMKQRLQ